MICIGVNLKFEYPYICQSLKQPSPGLYDWLASVWFYFVLKFLTEKNKGLLSYNMSIRLRYFSERLSLIIVMAKTLCYLLKSFLKLWKKTLILFEWQSYPNIAESWIWRIRLISFYTCSIQLRHITAFGWAAQAKTSLRIQNLSDRTLILAYSCNFGTII